MYPDTTPRAPVSRMEQAPGAENGRCSDGCGPLPECAPLAVPYVAFQQNNSKRYNQQEALNNGTLFPGLNLPFHLKPEAADVVNGPLAELQALVVSSAGGNPRRTSNGFDYNRAAMLLAVLEKRGGLKVSACDAYLNIVGGLSLDEPAADLAAVIALASSYLDRPVPSDLVAIGEVGLTGELRSVNQLGQRVSEIQRLGFRRCVVPAHRAGTIKAPTGLTVIPARNIGEAIRAALRPAE